MSLLSDYLIVIGSGIIATLAFEGYSRVFVRQLASGQISWRGLFGPELKEQAREEDSQANWNWIAVRFLIGVLFAFFYYGIFSLFKHQSVVFDRYSWTLYLALGIAIGLAHGGIVLLLAIARREKVASTNKKNLGQELFDLGLYQLGRHLAYGVCLGLMFATLENWIP